MAHAHHQPYDPYYQLQAAEPEMNNGINTLFVSGLPDDVKAREIHNLFRRRPGFDSCQLKYTGRGNQVVAFATFFNHQSAIAALHSLNGVRFDPQTGSTLHIELARSNSRRKHKPGRGAYVVIDERNKKSADAHETSSGDGQSDCDEAPATDNVDCANQDDSENAKSEGTGDPNNAVAAVNEQSEKTTEGGGGACSTLFIANLGPNCTEDELKQVLSQYPGFNILKLRAKGGMPVAFADFKMLSFLQKVGTIIDVGILSKRWDRRKDTLHMQKEIEQATQVMESLQDTTLPSSDRGGMHIEYARSKMRKQ